MMPLAVPASLVLLLSLGSAMAAIPVQANDSMTDQPMTDQRQTAATGDSADMEIQQGTVGQIGGSRIGVSSVVTTAPPVQGAMPGATATLVIAGDLAGSSIETTLIVHDRMLVPLADGLHRIEKLAPVSGRGARGHVALATAADSAVATGSVFLAEGGRLRIGGLSVDSAIDLRIVQIEPNSHAPKSLRVEWLPAAYARTDTPAAQIHQQTLNPGDDIQLGKLRLKVAAIEGRTQDHPCWIRFTASAAG